MFKPQSVERRDVMLIFFADIKGSLFRSDVEDNINQEAMKMGPVVTYGDCAEKQEAREQPNADRQEGVLEHALDIGTTETFDVQEHPQVGFANGTEPPPLTTPFQRPPISNFTRTHLMHADDDDSVHLYLDPEPDLALNYDDNDSDADSFSTTGGLSIQGDAEQTNVGDADDEIDNEHTLSDNDDDDGGNNDDGEFRD